MSRRTADVDANETSSRGALLIRSRPSANQRRPRLLATHVLQAARRRNRRADFDQAGQAVRAAARLSGDLNAYLRIDENGAVTLFSGKIEMGQGIHTSLAQMAAEELGVSLEPSPWSWAIPISARGIREWGSQSTAHVRPACARCRG